MALIIAFIVISLAFLAWKSYSSLAHPKWKTTNAEFPISWRNILTEYVNFYVALNSTERQKFENQVQEFLLNCKVTGIKTDIHDLDRVLVASSAVIPVFGFDEWQYTNIREVLLYPDSFDETYAVTGKKRNILGMVGNKSMENIMILSQKALVLGFKNDTDKKNTAIHEFVHLIDKKDGVIDGVTHILMDKQYTIPWLKLLESEMKKLKDGNSDINPYGSTNNAEFFSVISEYFFERPKLLQKKHPELYTQLARIFNQNMASRMLKRKK